MAGEINNIDTNDSIVCNNCGKVNNKENHICIFCGSSLSLSSKSKKIDTGSKVNTNYKVNSHETIENANEEKIIENANKEKDVNSILKDENEINKGAIDVKEDSFYCPKCGKLNDKGNNFCIHCGRALKSNNTDSNDEEDNEKNSHSVLFKVLGYLLTLACLYNPYFLIFFVVLGILSLFNKKTRAFGTSLFTGLLVTFITSIAFGIIIFGMCFFAL